MSDPPLSLLWWLPEYPPDPGGIATFAGHLVPALVGRGHGVAALVTRGGPGTVELAERCTLHRLPLREALEAGEPMQVARLGPATRRLKESVAAEVYHVHLCEPSPLVHLMTLDVAPAPTVLTMHNETISGFDPDDPDGLITRLFEASAIVTCVSSTATATFAEHAPRFAHRLVPISNGAPVPAEVVPVPMDPHLVAVGRLHPQKGFDRLLRSMPTVVRRIPEARLDILGEGPERLQLERLVGRLGIADHVTFHGNVTRVEVGGFLDRARVFVAPSRFEGLPYATLEAAGRARPVIATDVAGIDEVVVDGVTGLLLEDVSADDHPEIIAEAIVRLLTDHDECVAMGRAGRERVVRLFSLESCASAYEQVYRAARRARCEVAVVIPVHNGERLLAAAIDSALAAIAHAEVEGQVMVVDDGSTDGSAEIARGYRAAGVEVFSQPNSGVGMARNTGIALTSSEWVAHLDADDVWPVGRLRALLDAAAVAGPAAGIDAVFGRAVEFADVDAPTNARVDATPRAVRMGNVGIVRRSVFDRVGGFDAARTSDLLEWSSRAITAGLRYTQIDDVVLERRIHSSNMSHGRRFTTDTTRVALLKRHLDRRRMDPGG